MAHEGTKLVVDRRDDQKLTPLSPHFNSSYNVV